jgi:hypothetical protein
MRSLRALTLSVAASALALAAMAGEIKTDMQGGVGTERQLLQKDDETTAGSFDGTWMYVNRDAQFALWVRTKDGTPQMKLQYQSLGNPEAFETDWEGKSLYYMAGSPVTFELKLGQSTSDRIVGKWLWDLNIGSSARRESADVIIYRTGFGRTLLMDFQNYEKMLTSAGRNKIMRAPVVWNWTKISNRELLWEELPF